VSSAPLPPQNLDAEENALGAIMLAGVNGEKASSGVIEAIRSTGIEPADFYRESHRLIYEAMLAVDERGDPAEVLAVEQELRARRKLTAAGGTERLRVLAAVVPATSNAAHYAKLVRQEATLRELIRVGAEVSRLGWEQSGEPDALVDQARGLIDELTGRHAAANGRLRGLSTGEILGLDVPPTQTLVEGVIEAGTVGTFTGLPETFKSWLAEDVAYKVAAGGGSVLGRSVLRSGPVGYWWQDDSVENEVRRIQAYAGRHGHGGELPIRWHLNEGLRLPDDLPRLREEIERERQVLAFIDSLYNFLPGVTLKDEEVAEIYAAIKTDVCDQTGAAVGVVDHSPWPTEGNRGQRRAYGSVFKAAAIRWGIYLVVEGDTLYVEARGNNIAGLPRTPAMFDTERLELRILEAPSQEVDYDARIRDFLHRNRGAATRVVVAGVEGDDGAIRRRLHDSEEFVTLPPILFGKPRNTKCWANADEAADLLTATSVANSTDVAPTLPRETNDNLGGATHTHVVGGSRTDLGLSSSVEDAPTLNDNAAEEAAERRSS
jgi:hypothetical protein